MFEHIPELSIWEIAHYWHGYSPDQTDPKKLPGEVQAILKVLMEAGTRKSVLRVPKDSWLKQIIAAIFSPFYFLGLRWHVERTWRLRKFNKAILETIKIRREELARWCQNNNTPLPEFWFPPHNSTAKPLSAYENLQKLAGDKYVLFPLGHLEISLEHEARPTAKEAGAEEKAIPAPPPGHQQLQAAQKAHEYRNEIKKRFIRQCLAEFDKPAFNATQAARDFHAGLSLEEKYSLAQSFEAAKTMPVEQLEAKAIRTLTGTLRAYRKGEFSID